MRAGLLLIFLIVSAPVFAESPPLTFSPLLLDETQPEGSRVGELEFVGGLHIASPHPDFGGWSDLTVLPDGTLLAISDQGFWLKAKIARQEGAPVALEGAEMGALLGIGGKTIEGKNLKDAEGIAVLAEGGTLVSFERQHRLWRYPNDLTGAAELFIPPLSLDDLNEDWENAGMEAIAQLADARILVVLEGGHDVTDSRAYILEEGAWRQLAIGLEDDFRPTGLAALPDGGFVLLKRFFNEKTGPKARIYFHHSEDLLGTRLRKRRLLAELALPQSVDNFEGIAYWHDGQDAHLILLSDDNFKPREQRTLLLDFIWRK